MTNFDSVGKLMIKLSNIDGLVYDFKANRQTCFGENYILDILKNSRVNQNQMCMIL